MKILLVEEDESTSATLTTALTSQYYTVNVAMDGQTGLQLAQVLAYDLLLLDTLIPTLDGIDLCRQFRSSGYHNPILVLSEPYPLSALTLALDAGADDCLIKPFEIEELIARIRALLQRKPVHGSSVFIWGKLQFDRNTGDFSYNGESLYFTPPESSLLKLLLLNPNQVFSRRDLLEALWSDPVIGEERSTLAELKTLQDKLQAVGAPADFIETVEGLGYRLKSPTPSSFTRALSAVKQAEWQAKANASIAQVWNTFRPAFIASR